MRIRFGRVARMAAVVALALTIATGGVLVMTYHQATKIDRSVPKVVVRAYIDAALMQRDSTREQLYICESPSLNEIELLRDSLLLEEQAGVKTSVVIVSALESADGKAVDTLIQLNQGSGIQVDRRTQRWIFHMAEEDGWRVCSAERLPDPAPTPTATQPIAG